ncbi:hypothetical protein HD553DRAFT_312628 [Filobasidium floriforme]|uniref:uncharacterized protein n=1 Tax=Filobasidium floriforme TaxID=5210 RepID=UPI001E8D3B82|nr:uncharacterized protein HD553DRAFT_312628 [Filobasidium floriforme]KAH8083543.1 hypothetical protein HD553DRAFT_312628 [Filobasidium floriforme]
MTEVTSQDDTTMTEDNSGTRPVFDTTSKPSRQDPKDVIVGIHTTPQAKVVANDLIIRTIFGFLEKRSDLLSAMLLCKSLSYIPARLMYKTCSEDDLARVWTRGCSPVSCLPSFASGMCTNRTYLTSTGPLYGLAKISLPSETAEGMTSIKLEEAYLHDGRQILIQGERSLDGLDLTTRIFEVQTGDEVAWEGIRSIEIDRARPKTSFARTLKALIMSAIEADSDRSSLARLQRLSLLSIVLGITDLEKIFARCPYLTMLGCTLEPTEATKRSTYLDRLDDLMEGPGANIRELDVYCHPWTVMDYLSVLSGRPSVIHLTGYEEDFHLTDWTFERVEPFIPGDSGCQTQAFILSLQFEDTWDVNSPDPYTFAKSLRMCLPPGCAIKIDIFDNDPSEVQVTWVRIVRSILVALEREDMHSRKRGWTLVGGMDGSDLSR